jgi:hypothetical protein
MTSYRVDNQAAGHSDSLIGRQVEFTTCGGVVTGMEAV